MALMKTVTMLENIFSVLFDFLLKLSSQIKPFCFCRLPPSTSSLSYMSLRLHQKQASLDMEEMFWYWLSYSRNLWQPPPQYAASFILCWSRTGASAAICSYEIITSWRLNTQQENCWLFFKIQVFCLIFT